MGTPQIPKEFLGAFKKGHRLASKEFIDEELSYKLLKKVQEGCEESRLALEWLTRFNNEFHKAVIRRGDPRALHKTEELVRELDQRNYARRNDLYTLAPLVRNLSDV